jgi:hypothetical protein
MVVEIQPIHNFPHRTIPQHEFLQRSPLTYEYVGNLHMHTPYSDGHVTHQGVALAALRAGLDFVVTTDHNVWIKGLDGYRTMGDRKVLLLVGEEIHDQTREPQKNHMLVYETNRELSQHAQDPQKLLDHVNKAGGLAFIAHPTDPEAPAFNEADLSWNDWEVDGYVGLELWNFMSEFKGLLTSYLKALYYAYNPDRIATGPYAETLARWDSLLASGKKVVAIGGADAHAFPVRSGPLRRTLFPYEYHFRTVNTHVLTEEPLTGNVENDRARIFLAIRKGNCFVGYDLPASTKGFRFVGMGDDGKASMGDNLRSRFGITLQAKLPQRANLRLLRDGVEIRKWENCEAAVITVNDPGAYRLEASLFYKGQMRGWIYSNPIYVTKD